MREDDSNWFHDELPPPEELTPLTQTLITPDLALAFGIFTPHPITPRHVSQTPTTNNNSNPLLPGPNSGDFDSSSGGDESARTLKRPRLVWTPQLHKRFVDAVAHLGIKNAVPKTIMQLMSVDGLTRENVASHLQKYRLYLKRMQSLGSGGGGLVAGSGDPATDHLFASSPVPAHFLHPQGGGGRQSSEFYMGYGAAPPAPMVAQYGHRGMGQFGSFGSPFLSRQGQVVVGNSGGGGYGGEEGGVESGAAAAGGRRVLTLFPSGD